MNRFIFAVALMAFPSIATISQTTSEADREPNATGTLLDVLKIPKVADRSTYALVEKVFGKAIKSEQRESGSPIGYILQQSRVYPLSGDSGLYSVQIDVAFPSNIEITASNRHQFTPFLSVSSLFTVHLPENTDYKSSVEIVAKKVGISEKNLSEIPPLISDDSVESVLRRFGRSGQLPVGTRDGWRVELSRPGKLTGTTPDGMVAVGVRLSPKN